MILTESPNPFSISYLMTKTAHDILNRTPQFIIGNIFFQSDCNLNRYCNISSHVTAGEGGSGGREGKGGREEGEKKGGGREEGHMLNSTYKRETKRDILLHWWTLSFYKEEC